MTWNRSTTARSPVLFGLGAATTLLMLSAVHAMPLGGDDATRPQMIRAAVEPPAPEATKPVDEAAFEALVRELDELKARIGELEARLEMTGAREPSTAD